MTITQAFLTSEISSLWPDNTIGSITPANARTTLTDMVTAIFQTVSQNISISVGSADPTIPPTQNTPATQSIAVGGSYDDSSSGNIFQISSWADNTGTRPTVAIFGQGRAQGVSGRAWGGNFVGYAGNT